VRRRRLLYAIGRHSLLIALPLAFVLPFVFVLLTALMSSDQALSHRLIPHPFEWGNFAQVFHEVPIWRYVWNTTQIAVLATVGVILSCIPVAYALARMRWRGRQAVFVLVLATMMLPFQITIIPLYVIFTQLGWIGTLKPMIVPSFFGDAFSIFLLRQFFMTIPQEFSDAARVDGANELQIMLRVIVPLAKPAIAAVGLFSFIYNWNDFFAPLIFVGDNPNAWTMGIGLFEFRGLHHVQWNLMMAASVLFMIPTMVIFFLAQRVFIEGVTLTGVKG
jgi:multiple sugar transport system permease protein